MYRQPISILKQIANISTEVFSNPNHYHSRKLVACLYSSLSRYTHVKPTALNYFDNDMRMKNCNKKTRFYSDIKNDPEVEAVLHKITENFEDKSHYTDGSVTVEDIHHGSDNSSIIEGVKPPDIEDVEDFTEHLVAPPYKPPIDFKRGVRGVYNLDELLLLLEKENARDIVVVDIPREAQFGEHMVIASAVSNRHLSAISSRVKWIHKHKKSTVDGSLKVEGVNTASDWHAMDLGNIILHIFMPETRELYDLENLWQNWGQVVENTEVDKYAIDVDDEFWKSLEAEPSPNVSTK